MTFTGRIRLEKLKRISQAVSFPREETTSFNFASRSLGAAIRQLIRLRDDCSRRRYNICNRSAAACPIQNGAFNCPFVGEQLLMRADVSVYFRVTIHEPRSCLISDALFANCTDDCADDNFLDSPGRDWRRPGTRRFVFHSFPANSEQRLNNYPWDRAQIAAAAGRSCIRH